MAKDWHEIWVCLFIVLEAWSLPPFTSVPLCIFIALAMLHITNQRILSEKGTIASAALFTIS